MAKSENANRENKGIKMARKHTPIVSEAQFRAMAAARSAQEGKTDPSELYGAAAEMYESMKKTGPKSPKAHMGEAAGKRLPSKIARAMVKKSRYGK